MATLEDIARTWKKKSAQAIYPGLDSPLAKFKGRRTIKNFKQSTAFKTGNLLSQFVRKNADAAILATKIVSNNYFKYEFILDIAPDGAEYGKYVHNGTSKMGERPFARIGAQQQEVKDVIKQFLDAQAAEQLQKYKNILQPVFGDLSKT
jgi:hypothetical protein